MKLIEMNQEEGRTLKDRNLTALIPLGAVEVHANHLPIGTDLYLAQALTDKLEEKLGKENTLLLPALPYGQVWSLREAPGTINISNDVLSGMIVQIGKSLEKAGIKRMAIVNTHVGNGDAMKMAARMLYDTCDIKVFLFTYPGAEEVIPNVCESPMPHKGYFHACEIETSYMLYLCPEWVDQSKAICQYPDFPENFDYTPTPWTDFMDTAVLGDAVSATREKGEAIIEHVVNRMCEILEKEAIT